MNMFKIDKHILIRRMSVVFFIYMINDAPQDDGEYGCYSEINKK